LLGLGATRVGDHFADPDGNLFSLA
jgi:hypothetical protein